MTKTICRIKPAKKNRSRKNSKKDRKSVAQINEQCYVWLNNGKIEK